MTTNHEKLINLHEAWLKNSDYKKAYESMQIEYEMEWKRLSSISTTNNQNGPFNFTIDRFKHAAVLTHTKCGSLSQVDALE